MTPEHLPTEQYEAQLAEKRRLQSMRDGRRFRPGSGSSFARRSVTIVCVKWNFARGMTGDDLRTNIGVWISGIQKPDSR